MVEDNENSEVEKTPEEQQQIISLRARSAFRLVKQDMLKLAEKVRPEAQKLYRDEREHYIQARECPSILFLSMVWEKSKNSIISRKEKDRDKGYDWDEARVRYWTRLAEEAHKTIVENIAADDKSRRELHQQFIAACFANAQRLLQKLQDPETINNINILEESGRGAVRMLVDLMKVDKECISLEEKLLGNPQLRDAEKRHIADLRAIREVVLRHIGDPILLDRVRRDVDLLIIERERNYVNAMIPDMEEGEQELVELNNISRQIEEAQAKIGNKTP